MSSLLIKDGTVINPVGRSGKLDILIEDEKIIAVSPKITYDADEIIDALGCQVVPLSPYNTRCFFCANCEKLNYAPLEVIDCATTEFSEIHESIRSIIENDTRAVVKNISTADEVVLLRWAKANSDNIYAETTPYHFSFNFEQITGYNTLSRVTPPLQSERDRMTIINALGSGVIDMIATDYAPDPEGFIAKLKVSLALGITELVDYKYLSLEQLVNLMFINRAKVYSRDTDIPILDTGAIADIIVFDPYVHWGIYDEPPIPVSRLYGKVKYAIQNGQTTYHAKSLLG